MIVIEGLIGVGKTTLGKFMQETLNIPFYTELNSPNSLVLLDNFYKDKQRWSFALQVHFLNQKYAKIKEITTIKTESILDRSLYGDKVFADMHYHDNNMIKEEYEIYQELFTLIEASAKQATLVIYLDLDIDKAMERIILRNRGLENTIPRSYLESLNRHYLTWFDSYIGPKIKINYNNIDIRTKEGQESFLKIFNSLNIV